MKTRLPSLRGLLSAPIALVALLAAGEASAQTTYELWFDSTAPSVGFDGLVNVTAAAGTNYDYASPPGTNTWRAPLATGVTLHSSSQRNRFRRGASWTGTTEAVRAYTPPLDASRNVIAAGATARVDLQMRNVGTSSGTCVTQLYEYNDTSGVVGTMKGSASISYSESSSNVQTLSLTLSNPAFTVAVGNRLVVYFKLTTGSSSDPTILFASNFSNTTPAGHSSVTFTMSASSTETTTVGNGLTAEPAPALACPGSAQTALDNFTLRTSTGTDTVGSVTVSLAPANAFGNLATVSITDDAGATVHGSATPASSTVAIPLTTPITATVTETQYRVQLTPKTHAAMPSIPGASYATTGTVTAIGHTATNLLAYADTTSGGAITVDNASPADAAWGTISPGSTQVVLGWTNPPDADLSQIVVLRKVGSAPTESLTEGSSYAAGTTVGTSTVACVVGAPAVSCTDTSLTNGTTYWYKVFTRDACGNHSAGVATAQGYTPNVSTIVGNGTPAATSQSVCPPSTPGGTGVFVGAFDLSVSSGAADTVTSVTVSLSGGTASGVESVYLTTSGNVPQGARQTAPSGDNWTIAGLGLDAPPGTPAQYKVWVVPKSAAAMLAPPGSTYGIQARVTAIAHALANNATYGDAVEGVLTVDNASPASPVWGTVTPQSGQIVLGWTNPADSDFSQVVILRSTATIADLPVEGATYTAGATIGSSSVRYAGNLQTFTDATTNATAYYYKIFSRDACGNYSTGFQIGPYTFDPRVSPGVPTTAVILCNRVTITAPFSGDSNANSTTTVSRGAASGGPFPTVVCAGLTGASPRSCVDDGVAGGSTSYYQVVFTDADGVVGAPAQVTPEVATPPCGANDTTAGTLSATTASCTSVTVTAAFTGDDNGNGSVRIEYNTTSTWPGTTACAAASGPAPRTCLVTGLAANTSYFFRGTFTDPDGVSGTNPTAAVGAATAATCGPDTTPPTITLLAPSRNAIISGAEVFKLQVYDTGGLAASLPVRWQIDGTAGASFVATNVTTNASYACGTSCAVYEIQVPQQSIGSHYIAIRATDAAGNSAVVTWAFRARSAGAGTLLRRTSGSQLCVDCHTHQTHSSQYTTTRYGNWAADCATCHTPHQTPNIHLVRPTIDTPSSGTRAVDFRNTSGVAAYGFATPQASGVGVNVCEVCHTRTVNPDGTPRSRNDAPTDWTKHYTTSCIACHTHAKGFAAGESEGGVGCARCHTDIWNGMNGTTARTSRHSIGSVLDVNDSVTDSGLSWGAPLSGNAAAVRSCVNMCHDDHPHTAGGVTHDYNAYRDATTGAARAATTRDTATKARTDFDSTATNGGLCASCHQNPIDATRPAIDRAAFTASAHNYTVFGSFGAWTYTLHDGSVFERNCTKCHADRADTRPNASALPFGAVHYSSNPSLLAGNLNPAGTIGDTGATRFVCYNCHGNGTTGVDLSGKDLATDAAKTGGRHPVNQDALHSQATEETAPASTYDNGRYSGANRHVSCLDCHDTHSARAGIHAYATTATSSRNLASNPIAKVSAVAFSYAGLGNFGAPAAGNFTWIASSTGPTYEYQLCFKCHTSFTFGATPPNGLSPNGAVTTPVETDVAQEFNPNNFSGHPVVVGLDSYPNSGAVNPAPHQKGLTASDLLAPWNTNLGTQTMMCSDCHNTDSASPAAQGPHGSALSFMTRGTKTGWPTANANSTGFATTMCSDCHTNAPIHTEDGAHETNCYRCHIVVPHGGKMSRLIGDGDSGSAMPARYAYGNDKTTMYIQSFTKRARNSYEDIDCQTSCTTRHNTAATENW